MKKFFKYFCLVIFCSMIGAFSVELVKNNTFRNKVVSIVKNTKKESKSVVDEDLRNESPEKKTEDSAFEIIVPQKEEEKNTEEPASIENAGANERIEEVGTSENTTETKEIVRSNQEEDVSVLSTESDSDALQYNEVDVSVPFVQENDNFSNNADDSVDNVINILELVPVDSNTSGDSSNNNNSFGIACSETNSSTNSSDTSTDSSSMVDDVSDDSTNSSNATNSNVPTNDSSVANDNVSSTENTTSYTNSITGTGKGPVKDISIKYHVKDSKGRCGKGSGDYCAAVATVKYTTGTVKYYMGYQNNSQIIGGSCRSHAFMAATNAIKGTNYSTLDLQKYLYSVGYNGVLKAKGITKSIKHYDLSAKVYHSETSKKKAATLIKKALDNGQPVMIFVQHSLCSDLAGTHHALLLLGYDKNNKVVFIDSAAYSRNAKKRTVSEISKCLSNDSISDSYYRMIIFSF